MRYEVITDTEDMLILLVNSRAIAISSDMSTIMRVMGENYTKYMKRNKRLSEPLYIDPELYVYDDKSVIKPVTKPIVKTNTTDEEGKINSLGNLFTL
jgi:hypothetical protein